ncbi:hypothetical protein NL676_035114 [Syzygium grande]|nr:hypothetical protein NL676_035114 [Syzygium grande]
MVSHSTFRPVAVPVVAARCARRSRRPGRRSTAATPMCRGQQRGHGEAAGLARTGVAHPARRASPWTSLNLAAAGQATAMGEAKRPWPPLDLAAVMARPLLDLVVQI